ncbi:uncharacterized protein [Drosophila virilis]|uniref:Uncharacterized protein n=1 Tax=Drosophila virilis TaxID=7244 RepID=A0A0Q9WGW7_DROVI|nr:uncharacterized protein LOC26531187 [Drosophila virilis]KRF83768.1 uncharacterized protein Dvir_GJ26417 [Drosophila virilis]
MTTCTFLFDIIVTNIKSPSINTQDLKELLIGVKFNNVSIPITASRINVTDFKPNSETAVTVSPTDLRQTLEECGIPISVMYNGLLLGIGHLRLRKDFIESIKEDMSELIQVDSCTFKWDGQVIGALEVLYRLVVKCEEQIVVQNIFKDKSINEEDILFIVSESQRCPSFCDPCLDAFEDAETLKFGIQNFGSLNVNDPKPSVTFLHNPVSDAACCEIKKMAQDCEETVDLITRFSGQPKALKPPCRYPPNLNSPCNVPSQRQPKVTTLLPCFTCIPMSDGGNKNTRDPALITGTIRRNCPDCQANMTWLPPLAACPKCGVQPMAFVMESNNQPAADEILIENLGKSPDTSMDVCADFIDKTGMEETVTNENRCRCTCKFEKLCAYCRVRNMCADIFQSNEKPVSEKAEEDNEISKDICASNAESDVFRPFLSRVFSELVILNYIKTVKPTEIAEQSIQKSTSKEKEPHINKNSISIAERRELTRQRIARKAVKKSMRSISPRHGWDWSSSEEARKHGWRPGFIRKPIKKLMKFFLKHSPEKCKKAREAEMEKERQLPILNFRKKNGEIFITLRPLNNTNVDMKPIVFKLVKSDLAVALREIKSKLKRKGFRKCTCHQTLMMCVCRDNFEKKHLELALQKECKRRGIQNCVEHLVLTDTSESEMEFNFDMTPPAAMANRDSPPMRRLFNNGTQTDEADLEVPPRHPSSYRPNWRAYDCGASGRYTGTAFGAPAEEVFEDGVFGYRGGGPHGTADVPHDSSKGGPLRVGGRGREWSTPGGETFPYGNKKKPTGGSDPIPVKMTRRYYQAIENAAEAEKKAKADAAEAKRRGPDMIKYLIKTGTIPKPWNPNDYA